MQIFIVLKNADFTEGRGPMLFHSAWTDGEEAIKWVSKQPGIYGSPQRIERDKHRRYVSANGYDIEEHTLVAFAEELEAANIEAERQAALKKLTPRDRALLGIKE